MTLKIDENGAILTYKINKRDKFVISKQVLQDEELNYRFAIAIYGNRAWQLIN